VQTRTGPRAVTTTAEQQTPKANKPWRYPLFGGVGAVFLTFLVKTTPVPIWGLWAVAAAGAALTFVFERRNHPMPRVWFLVACWLAPVGWTTGTALFGWNAYSWVLLAVLALVAGLLARGLVPVEATKPAAAPSFDPISSEHPRARHLRTLLNALLGLDKVPGTGLKLVGFTLWDEAAGYTCVFDFPPGGRVTMRKVIQSAEELTAELRLQHGCVARITKGDHSAQVRVAVMLRNSLEQTRPYPPVRVLSIRGDLPVGFDAMGDEVGVNLHQSSLLAVAQRKGGKTVFAHDLIASLVSCPDVLVWVVDLNGGNLATPWLRPYAQDHVQNPAVDWIAFTAEEAFVMAEAAEKIAKARKISYASLLAEHDTDILPVSSQLPAIVIIVDEGGEVFGDGAAREVREAAANLLTVQRIARAVCMPLVVTTQRGTSTYLPADLKRATDVRLAGRVDSEAEVANVLDWEAGLPPDQLEPGEWWLRVQGTTPVKIKTYMHKPSTSAAIAAEVDIRRPQLDQLSRDAAGRLYAERWQRAYPYLRRIAGYEEEEEGAPVVPEPPVRYRGPAEIAEETARFAQQFTGPVAPAEDHEAQPARPAGSTVDTLGAGPARYYELCLEAGPDGIKTEQLVHQLRDVEGLTDRRQTVSDWNTILRELRLVGPHPRGYGMWMATIYLDDGAKDQAA
jgi:S-DNA-T family DNA segregation ATPase FtsK/SpoIIIE